MYIDTHAHIYADQFKKDLEETLARAHQAGVGKILMPNIDHTSIDSMMEVELKDPANYIAMMGLHPCSVKKDFERELYLIEEWFGKRDFIAVGEVGIDLYWDKTFLSQQVEALKIQVEWAKQRKVPVVIHARDSLSEIFEVLDELNDDDLTGVFHCFSGDLKEAEQALSYGFYLGIGGVSTFKNGGLDMVLPHVSLDHIVLETDCPYLAPVPHRGKRNESSYIPLIAKRVADLMEKEVEEVEEMTTQNALNMFQLI